MRVPLFAALLIAGFLGACQSNDTAGTSTTPTLLVTNATCLSGHCDSLEILAFPSNQPLTPGGLWSIDLGLMTGPQACVTLPPSATFRVTGPDSTGVVHTVIYTWTPAVSLSLGAIAPEGGRLQASPTTAAFVPASAAGWRVTLPGSQLLSDSGCVR
jgi:hypothetical protein